jgi:hypothetical protein
MINQIKSGMEKLKERRGRPKKKINLMLSDQLHISLLQQPFAYSQI